MIILSVGIPAFDDRHDWDLPRNFQIQIKLAKLAQRDYFFV
jgi:hypothetical protein